MGAAQGEGKGPAVVFLQIISYFFPYFVVLVIIRSFQSLSPELYPVFLLPVTFPLALSLMRGWAEG